MCHRFDSHQGDILLSLIGVKATYLCENHDNSRMMGNDAGGPGLHGVLKVTAPNVIGHSIVVPVLAKMMADNPSLRVELTLADGLVYLVAAGLDVAIRVSPMELSDMITTRVAENPRVVCASPTYITRFGAPQTTDDLISHECIRLHNMDTWPFRVNGELRRLAVAGLFSASTVDAVRSACIEGMGIAMMTFWDVRQALRDEYLVELTFKDVEADQLGVWAVYPTKSHTPMRVHSLIEALRAHFSSMESEAV